jgi:hypothetical protein
MAGIVNEVLYGINADFSTVGILAEDADENFPDLCLYNDEGLPESVKYHEMPALLLNEIQKLVKRIEELERKYATT